MDAAAGLAIFLRETAADFEVATSRKVRDGYSAPWLRSSDAIVSSQPHSSTYLKRALTELRNKRAWSDLDRVIVITDEQSHDGIAPAWTPKAYVVNVAPVSARRKLR